MIMTQFSLIIPVYNNVSTLPATLASVLNLEGKENIELVVSDDASTDGTREFLTSWFDEHGRILKRAKLLLNESNVGISGNHARGFEAAEGDYGLYMGGDDLLGNARIFSELEIALASKPRLAIAKLDVEALFASDGRRERIYRHKLSFFQMSPGRQFVSLALYGNFLYAGPGTLLHIPTLRKIGGGFDVRFRTYEDMPLYMAFLAAGYQIRFIPVGGVLWVRAASSLSMRGFAGMRPRFEQEGILIRGLIQARWCLLSFHERLIYRARRLPKYVRYLVFATSVRWLRLRLIPSIVRKAFTIAKPPLALRGKAKEFRLDGAGQRPK